MFSYHIFRNISKVAPFKTLSGDQGQSIMTVEWTNQHGCGGNELNDPQKQNCHMILQYMCQDDADTPTGKSWRNYWTTLRSKANMNLHYTLGYWFSKRILIWKELLNDRQKQKCHTVVL